MEVINNPKKIKSLSIKQLIEQLLARGIVKINVLSYRTIHGNIRYHIPRVGKNPTAWCRGTVRSEQLSTFDLENYRSDERRFHLCQVCLREFLKAYDRFRECEKEVSFVIAENKT